MMLGWWRFEFLWDSTSLFIIRRSTFDILLVEKVEKVEKVEEVETVAFGSLVETRPLDFGLGASQVEMIGFLSGILLHYLIFGILFGFLVEEVDSLR